MGFEFEVLSEVLNEAAKADLTQKIIVFMIMWWFVKKTIRTHFNRVEDVLTQLVQTVKEATSALRDHSTRLGNLETDMSNVKGRLGSLEHKEE